MNRTIKFRGRVCDENKAQSDQGKTVYGNCLFQYPNGTVALSHTIKLALTFVDPESVAQFVGYDKDGNEVYEGDKILIDDAGEDEFFATCLPVGVNHWGGCFLHGGNFIFTKEFSLKEACQNPWNALQEIDNLIERHVEEAKQ